MIAIPQPSDERTPDKLDLEHSKADIAMVRSLVKRGLLPAEHIQELAERLERVAAANEGDRLGMAADKTLASMQVALLRLLVDCGKGSGMESASVTNQQINIYLPSNGRETQPALPSANGNGKH